MNNVTKFRCWLAVLMVSTICGCSRVVVSVGQQAQLNESLNTSGLHAKYAAAGMSGITLDDPLQSELSGKSLETIVTVVKKWREKNQISISSIGIQGPNSYVGIDL